MTFKSRQYQRPARQFGIPAWTARSLLQDRQARAEQEIANLRDPACPALSSFSRSTGRVQAGPAAPAQPRRTAPGAAAKPSCESLQDNLFRQPPRRCARSRHPDHPGPNPRWLSEGGTDSETEQLCRKRIYEGLNLPRPIDNELETREEFGCEQLQDAIWIELRSDSIEKTAANGIVLGGSGAGAMPMYRRATMRAHCPARSGPGSTRKPMKASWVSASPMIENVPACPTALPVRTRPVVAA